MKISNEYLLNNIKRLKALAETGLLYAKNEYDIERYQELQEISYELLSEVGNQPIEALKQHLPLSTDYPTAKVDIRCLIVGEDNRILLAKESADGKWSLPGGWADVGSTPKETAIKECKEETGLDVTPVALLAVFDKKMHPHPPQPFYVYKMVIHCQTTSHQITKGFDVLDVQYFGMDELPELSVDRILKSQIELVYRKVMEKDSLVYFD